MTSAAKIEANRRNARASTGPRSAAAKARTRRNAFRHGLAVPPEYDCVIAAQIEPLAREIANDDELRDVARAVAGAMLDVQRVRRTRIEQVNRVARNLQNAELLTKDERKSLAFAANGKHLEAFDRYERRAVSRRTHALATLASLQAQPVQWREIHLSPSDLAEPPIAISLQRELAELVAQRRQSNLTLASSDVELKKAIRKSIHSRLPEGPDTFKYLELDIDELSNAAHTTAAGACYSNTLNYDDGFPIKSVRMRLEMPLRENSFSLVIEFRDGTIKSQDLTISETRGTYGKIKWRVRCPATGERVEKLFLRASDQQFQSRHRAELSYGVVTQIEYDCVYARAIRAMRMLGGQDPLAIPPRPHCMHERTYLHYAAMMQPYLEMMAVLAGWPIPEFNVQTKRPRRRR